MDMDLFQKKVFEKTRRIVATQLCLEVNQVLPDSNFSTDLGADSLDMVELMMALEEAFEIDISEDVASNITTVNEAVEVIAGNVDESQLD